MENLIFTGGGQTPQVLYKDLGTGTKDVTDYDYIVIEMAA